MMDVIYILIGLLAVFLCLVLAIMCYLVYLITAIVKNSIWYIMDEPIGINLLTPVGMVKFIAEAEKQFDDPVKDYRDIVNFAMRELVWRP